MSEYKFTWGEPIYVEGSSGDTWDPAWAEDDLLYVGSNDTSGFFDQPKRNVSFGCVRGDDIHTLAGETLNTMDEYGEMCVKLDDQCTWKTSGCVCVDGVLYFVVGRHCYGNESGDSAKRQTVRCASIIKSYDKGKTWEPKAPHNREKPMFAAPFSTPYFIHYGKNNDTSLVPKEHGADEYIYAVSNNGFWDNGDFFILGRVPKVKLENLQGGDWEYYVAQDGTDFMWSKNAEDASKIIDNPGRCGECGITYIKSIKKYILISWYYHENGRDKPSDTSFIIYMSSTPWGEWKPVSTRRNNPEGWYCPRIVPKFEAAAENGDIHLAVCTGGDYTTGFGTGIVDYYKMTILPLTIHKAE